MMTTANEKKPTPASHWEQSWYQVKTQILNAVPGSRVAHGTIAEFYGDNAEENAAQVILCVKSHDDLLAACESARAFLRDGSNPAAGCVAAPTAEVALQQMLDAAISKANGGAV